MSRPDLDTPEGRAVYQAELRPVGALWRIAGTALVILAAIVLIVAKGLNLGLHAPLMIAGFAVLALGWIAAFVGIWLRIRHNTRRLREL